MTRAFLTFVAGAITCALLFAAHGLTEMAYVAAWMACRALTSGVCL